ncbi:unnamed protein product [Aphis gossypii]|uniref:Uncharacterized protein n=1 Tax=Aphis gossypii TaxID=80765 RepID=A0A9P0IPU9_APHGO|nr:unnamed protein product [Aphis gossypii]
METTDTGRPLAKDIVKIIVAETTKVLVVCIII